MDNFVLLFRNLVKMKYNIINKIENINKKKFNSRQTKILKIHQSDHFQITKNDFHWKILPMPMLINLNKTIHYNFCFQNLDLPIVANMLANSHDWLHEMIPQNLAYTPLVKGLRLHCINVELPMVLLRRFPPNGSQQGKEVMEEREIFQWRLLKKTP